MRYGHTAMKWAFWWFLVFCGSVRSKSRTLGTEVEFGRFDDNSLEDYDYDYADWFNYFFIYPGTKWCGAGNIAAHNEDLGIFSKTDMCCREHDMCDSIIGGGKTKYGLTNPAPYTRLDCACDEKFLNCLKNSKDETKASKVVGTMYFDLLNTKCFKLEHKVIGCKQFSSLGTRCLKYEIDPSSQKTYQWFDVPMFNSR